MGYYVTTTTITTTNPRNKLFQINNYIYKILHIYYIYLCLRIYIKLKKDTSIYSDLVYLETLAYIMQFILCLSVSMCGG